MLSSQHTKKAALWYRRLWLMVLRGLPHHALGRLISIVAQWSGFTGKWLVRAYARVYAVRLKEAEPEGIEDYKTLNQLFTRQLKKNARTLCNAPGALMSPCDGRITQIGTIKDNTLLQVKQHQLLLSELLGEAAPHSAHRLEQTPAYNRFCIIYLAPSDCHRVFMPVDGRLDKMIHIPGRLLPLSPRMTSMVASVHQHNERVVCLFTTALGRLAVVLVGAMNVGTISTSWHGIVAPARLTPTSIYYQQDRPSVYLRRGQELGCFQLGSSVVLLLENKQLVWNPAHPAGKKIQLGMELASMINPAGASAQTTPPGDASAMSNVAARRQQPSTDDSSTSV